MKRNKKNPLAGQPKVRDYGMVAMHQRGGDGTHGGGKRARNRRDRQNFKLDLRRGDYA